MADEKACGVIIYKNENNTRKYVIIRGVGLYQGYYGFPKGHMEPGETEIMTAIREVFEETAVQVHIDSKFRETVHYSPMPGVEKEVVYFLTRTEQTEITPRVGEIAEVEWVPLEKAESYLTHENDKTVLRAAIAHRQNAHV